MVIATEMKKITSDIASSYEDRMKRIGEIQEEASKVMREAQSLIKGFEVSRKQTGRQLRRDLNQDKALRKSEAKGILREAQEILRGFETSRQEANAQLRKELSQGTAEVRTKAKEILEDAEKSIKGFHASRKKLSSELRKELIRSRSTAKSEVGELLGDFRKTQADVRANIKGTQEAWQELASTMQSKRAKVKVSPKARVVKEKVSDLKTKLLEAVNEHPEGITLAKVADSLGVAPVVLARASKSLLGKGKVHKKDKFYFPIAGQ
jgi:hypothetical protein